MTVSDGTDPNGPPVELLMRRLVDTPSEFLGLPRIGSSRGVDVAAVVSDLFVALGTGGLRPEDAEVFRTADPARQPWLRTVLVTAWVLFEPELVARKLIDATWTLLSSGLSDLSGLVAPDDLVSDPDRREELARRVLAGLGLTPAGETAAQAADRLRTLDSAERARVLEATRAAELRAAEVRQAMHSKAAAEAAAKASRE